MGYIENLAKVELHCHLDGSIPKHTMEELLGREVSKAELSVSEDCKNLSEYLEKFQLPLSVMCNYTALKKSAKDFVLSLKPDHVVYAEVRFAPLLHTNDNLSLSEVMEAVIDGLKEGKELTGIDVGLIACMMRHHEFDRSLDMIKQIRDYLGYGLNAVDLAGDESKYHMSNFIELFKQAKAMGYEYTIHAGECKDVSNVALSIDVGAKRIGHGIALSGHKELIELARSNRVGIEMCPISNMQTKAVDDMSAYPLREFMDAGLLVSINTDNRTVSDSTMAKELHFIADRYKLEEEEIRKLMLSASEMSFADDNIKHNLYKIFN